MLQTVTKAQFKAQALQYLREVEQKKQPLVITHLGKPVVQITPYEDRSEDELLQSLRGTVLKYEDPTDPVGVEDWEALQ